MYFYARARGSEIVERLTGRQVPVVLDPTMLLLPGEWRAWRVGRRRWLRACRLCSSTFLVTTCTTRRSRASRAIWARRVVDVRDRRLRIGPSEFVWLAAHAAAVCTDSFHGCVFSLLHHMPLCLFERASKIDMSSRMDTLCDLFGMACCRERSEGFDMYGMDWGAFEARSRS